MYLELNTVAKNIKSITRTFQIEIPITYLQTNGVMIGLFSLYGIPFVTESSGGSVERAIAAKVSMIKFTHRS